MRGRHRDVDEEHPLRRPSDMGKRIKRYEKRYGHSSLVYSSEDWWRLFVLAIIKNYINVLPTVFSYEEITIGSCDCGNGLLSSMLGKLNIS